MLISQKERQSLATFFSPKGTSMEPTADLLLALTNFVLNKDSSPKVVAELKVLVAMKADAVMRKHPRGRPKGTSLSYGEPVDE